MAEVLLNQGAEAKLYLGELDGKECVIKERFSKKYRHPQLDTQITKERTRAEYKAISRCAAAGIRTPQVYQIDMNTRKIFMEYLSKSISAKDYIKNNIKQLSELEAKQSLEKLCTELGRLIGKLHANNVIHGDLTTSNFLINPLEEDFAEYEIVIIDFGLSHYSQSSEDKGVDLYVLERAVISTHSDLFNLFDVVLSAYSKELSNAKDNIAKLEEVRTRGRKRTMIG